MINERKLAAIKKNAAINAKAKRVEFKRFMVDNSLLTGDATEECKAKKSGYTKSLHWWWW